MLKKESMVATLVDNDLRLNHSSSLYPLCQIRKAIIRSIVNQIAKDQSMRLFSTNPHRSPFSAASSIRTASCISTVCLQDVRTLVTKQSKGSTNMIFKDTLFFFIVLSYLGEPSGCLGSLSLFVFLYKSIMVFSKSSSMVILLFLPTEQMSQ